MHRPLPLCWQLKYSGSKAEKDTFTSIQSEYRYHRTTSRTQEIVYCPNRVRWHDTLLTSPVSECTFCTSPTHHLVWIYCFVTWCCATNTFRILCDSLLLDTIGFCCIQLPLPCSFSVHLSENALVSFKSFWECMMYLSTEWNVAIECIIKRDNGFKKRYYPTTFGIIII